MWKLHRVVSFGSCDTSMCFWIIFKLMKQSKAFKPIQANFLPAWHFLSVLFLEAPKPYTAPSLEESVVLVAQERRHRGLVPSSLSLGLPLGERKGALWHPKEIWNPCHKDTGITFFYSSGMIMYPHVSFIWSLQGQQNGNCICNRASIVILSLWKAPKSQAVLVLGVLSGWKQYVLYTWHSIFHKTCQSLSWQPGKWKCTKLVLWH